MIRLSYPKAQGSYGLIECSALQLDVANLRTVQDDGSFVSHTLFVSYDGRFLRDGGSWLGKDIHEEMDELIIDCDDAHSLVVAQDNGLKTMLGGSDGPLVLLAGRDGLKLANSQGAVVTLSDPQSSWHGVDGKDVGRRLLVGTMAYILGEVGGGDETGTIWEASPRSRPSALAERSLASV